MLRETLTNWRRSRGDLAGSSRFLKSSHMVKRQRCYRAWKAEGSMLVMFRYWSAFHEEDIYPILGGKIASENHGRFWLYSKKNLSDN